MSRERLLVTSADGKYEARLRPDVEYVDIDGRRTGRSEVEEFDVKTSIDQDRLDLHAWAAHLAGGDGLAVVGLRYDAELAAFLGFSLKRTAKAMRDNLIDISQGKQTPELYSVVQRIFRRTDPKAYAVDPKAFDHSEYTARYVGLLHTEFARFTALGVAGDIELPQPDLGVNPSNDVLPIRHDSFFTEFHIVSTTVEGVQLS